MESPGLSKAPNPNLAEAGNPAREVEPAGAHRHTIANGHRSFDVLHVATALHLGAKEFLTFDTNQRKLAGVEGLAVRP